MPINIGTMSSHVTVNDRSADGAPDPEALERLVKMVAARLKEMDDSGDKDGEIPQNRTEQ
ncbi:MAG: hypothetical protein JST22_11455 [Bacteroidetes bacterium]|nr:hypothetical protein [Bacteroidota bacterium]